MKIKINNKPQKSKNWQKWSKNQKNPEKSRKIFKSHFFYFLFCSKKILQKKNASLLVFQYQEDAIRPELSSSSRFRNTKMFKNINKSLLKKNEEEEKKLPKKEKKNAILLVFQYQEDTIRPELSSPALFRIFFNK